jgi:signal transduction histidine kinase
MSESIPPAAHVEQRDVRFQTTSHALGARAETDIRTLHLRISLLPTAAMALLAAVPTAFLLSMAQLSTTTSLVLVVTVAGVLLVLAGATYGADTATRLFHQRLAALRFSSARADGDLWRVVERLKTGERLTPHTTEPPSAEERDPFVLLAHDLRRAQYSAQNAVLQASDLRSGVAAAPDQRVEVFVNLARRMQSLVHREIQLLDELEAKVEDPDLLKGLFTVDHLATRMRRQSESLAVLGGASSRRRWSRPVSMFEVLRSAVAEVEQYSRVKVVPPVEGTLDGSAVADVIHLVAELVENATKFSAPHTQVLLRAEKVTAGLAIEVEDRGLGIPRDEQGRLNDLLAEPGRVNVGELLYDGRIGLFVVSALGRRHGIKIQLRTNIYGGLQATVVVPQALIDAGPRNEEADQRPTGPQVAVADDPRPSLPAGGSAVGTVRRTAIETAVSPVTREPARPASSGAWTVDPVRDHRVEEGGERPPLPRRDVQKHLAPQLRDARTTRQEDVTEGHDPGLMAAFQGGVNRAEEDDENDLPGRP